MSCNCAHFYFSFAPIPNDSVSVNVNPTSSQYIQIACFPTLSRSPHPPTFHPFLSCHVFSFVILAPTSTPALSAQGKVAQTACMSACKHLSTSLMQMLLDTELKQISMGAIQQFNLDVIQCERKWTRLSFDISLQAVVHVPSAGHRYGEKGWESALHWMWRVVDVMICAVCVSQCLPVPSRSLGFKVTLSSWPLLICDR